MRSQARRDWFATRSVAVMAVGVPDPMNACHAVRTDWEKHAFKVVTQVWGKTSNTLMD